MRFLFGPKRKWTYPNTLRSISVNSATETITAMAIIREDKTKINEGDTLL